MPKGIYSSVMDQYTEGKIEVHHMAPRPDIHCTIDTRLNKLLAGVTIAQGGVLPNQHPGCSAAQEASLQGVLSGH